MCTYEDCAEGDQQYDNFNDWVSHEVNVHRHNIAPSQQPSEECRLTPELSKGPFQPQYSISPNDISRQECPICLEKNPTFYHIGLHLRRVAVFALPNSVGTDEDTLPGDQGSNNANVDEENSVSSQSISSWMGKDSMHENDQDGELHKRNRSTSETREGFNLLEHALREFDGAFDESDMERYFAGLASENTSSYREEPINAEPPSQIHQLGSASNISFYVLIEQLGPDYQAQGAQQGPRGFWSPPTIMNGYTTISRSLFLWRGGIMTHIVAHEQVGNPFGHLYSAATVFTQTPDTPHLLAVPFDARRRHVHLYPGAWRHLTFHHVRKDATKRIYSAVSVNGNRQHIAAPGSAHWMPQLLPRIYDDPHRSRSKQAGLIGSIPLLIALAALSAPISFLQSVLTSCVQPGQWLHHQYPYPAGRKLQNSMGILI